MDYDIEETYNKGLQDPMGNSVADQESSLSQYINRKVCPLPLKDRQYTIRTNDWSTGQQTTSQPFKLYDDPSSAGVSLGTNPKDLVGSTKVSITKLPPIATVMGAMAMMDGANKYGAYNWRSNKVIASIYVDAAYRHLMAWFEGQENAGDSSVHHLGHVIACAGILLDAQATGNLVDDRPTIACLNGQQGNWFTDLLDKLSVVIKGKLRKK